MRSGPGPEIARRPVVPSGPPEADRPRPAQARPERLHRLGEGGRDLDDGGDGRVVGRVDLPPPPHPTPMPRAGSSGRVADGVISSSGPRAAHGNGSGAQPAKGDSKGM